MTTTSREQILARVRAALAGRADRRPHPGTPDDLTFAGPGPGPGPGRNQVELFCEQMRAVGGRVFTDPATLGTWLVARGATSGLCDPALLSILEPGLGASVALKTSLNRAQIDDYAFGLTRATGAIAATGTLILNDADTWSRLAALAPWIHIAVLGPRQIHARVVDAIAALGGDPNVVWCTGPSKTADVEGILIQGVHGPGEQVVLILPPL